MPPPMSIRLSPPPIARMPSRSSRVVLFGPRRRYFLRSPSATLASNISCAPVQKLEQQEPIVARPLGRHARDHPAHSGPSIRSARGGIAAHVRESAAGEYEDRVTVLRACQPSATLS